MGDHKSIFSIILALFLALPAFAQQAGSTVALWRDRGDVTVLNLLDGPEGKIASRGTALNSSKKPKVGLRPSLRSKMKTAPGGK